MGKKKTTSPKRENLNRIKEVAETKGVTQAWIAEKMGVSDITVAFWYQQRRHPNLKDLKRLAAILKVSACDLINEE